MVTALEEEAGRLEDDPLATETYVENLPEVPNENVPVITATHLEAALEFFQGDFGPRVRSRKQPHVYEVSLPGSKKILYGASIEALEKNPHLRPLSPLDPELWQLAVKLWRPGERLPLVVGSYQQGNYRVAVAYWIHGKQIGQVTSLEELKRKVEAWDGISPNAE